MGPVVVALPETGAIPTVGIAMGDRDIVVSLLWRMALANL
jgi:hypothetical protein